MSPKRARANTKQPPITRMKRRASRFSQITTKTPVSSTDYHDYGNKIWYEQSLATDCCHPPPSENKWCSRKLKME